MTQNRKIVSFLENSLIVFNGLILAFVIGKQYISLPPFLEVFGRMHPLLLHFPIVLLVLAGLLFWFPKILDHNSNSLLQILLLLSLFFTGLTVIAGLFLSAEEGYVQEDLQNHQWTGLLVFWLGSVWYLAWAKGKSILAKTMSVSVLVLVLVTGHLGASLTHGEDFLLFPISSKVSAPVVSLEEAVAYDHIIRPILEQKCVSCHKASKQKGDLRLDEVRFILAGGKNGDVIDLENPENSEILQRISLPIEEEEHMPPKGKPQLTETEIQLLETWILENALFEKKVVEYPETSPFFTFANTLFDDKKEEVYDFDFASKKTITGLNHEYRVVQALYPDSPALRVSYFGKAQFDAASLDELKKINIQLVDLNLQNMSLKDEDLSYLSHFQNLKILNLNFTGINGSGLQHVQDLKKLKSLSLTGNNLSEDAVNYLKKLSHLEALFIWNTGLDNKTIAELKSELPKTKIETGYSDDGEIYQLNPPEIKAEKAIFTGEMEINLKHPIGSVSIFYTLDNTIPDSSNHILYEGPFKIDKNITLRTRAFADGWSGSDEKSAVFLKSGIKPDEVTFLQSPDKRFKANGTATLFDLEKGDEEFSSGSWLGFRQNPMEIKMEFNETRTINNIAFSLLEVGASYIVPPYKIEIWSTGKDGTERLIQTDFPEQPEKIRKNQVFLKEYPIKKENVSAIRAKLSPVNPLPKWHPGAGEKGWVFIDEILIN
ncbi:c-type cytochrome domain-containing protein [Aquiflexum sp.]|uniref:c-type cytochrome domain-containing protein n=1 Tax=Aquiflexum sp. TaxID=1872584 RepID=UPI0035941957